jgi:hypothetical protein
MNYLDNMIQAKFVYKNKTNTKLMLIVIISHDYVKVSYIEP